MSRLIRKVKRKGTENLMFQFDVIIHEMDEVQVSPGADVRVDLIRGARTAMSKPVRVDGSKIAVRQQLTLFATMYRNTAKGRFESKRCKVVVREVATINNKARVVASLSLDLAEFVNMTREHPSNPHFLQLSPTGLIKATIWANGVGEGRDEEEEADEEMARAMQLAAETEGRTEVANDEELAALTSELNEVREENDAVRDENEELREAVLKLEKEKAEAVKEAQAAVAAAAAAADAFADAGPRGDDGKGKEKIVDGDDGHAAAADDDKDGDDDAELSPYDLLYNSLAADLRSMLQDAESDMKRAGDEGIAPSELAEERYSDLVERIDDLCERLTLEDDGHDDEDSETMPADKKAYRDLVSSVSDLIPVDEEEEMDLNDSASFDSLQLTEKKHEETVGKLRELVREAEERKRVEKERRAEERRKARQGAAAAVAVAAPADAAELEQLRAALEEEKAARAAAEAQLAETRDVVAEQKALLAEKDAALAEKDALIAEKTEALIKQTSKDADADSDADGGESGAADRAELVMDLRNAEEKIKTLEGELAAVEQLLKQVQEEQGETSVAVAVAKTTTSCGHEEELEDLRKQVHEMEETNHELVDRVADLERRQAPQVISSGFALPSSAFGEDEEKADEDGVDMLDIDDFEQEDETAHLAVGINRSREKELEAEIEELHKEKREWESKKQTMTESLLLLQTQLASVKAEVEEGEEVDHAALEKLQAENEEMNSSVAVLEEANDELEAELEEARDEIAALKVQLAAAGTASTSSETIRDESAKIDELLERISELEDELEKVEVNQMKSASAEHELAERTHEPNHEEVVRLRDELHGKQAQMDEIIARVEELEAELKDKEAEMAAAAAAAAAASATAVAVASSDSSEAEELARLREQIASKDERLTELIARIEEMEGEIERVEINRMKADEAEKEAEALRGDPSEAEELHRLRDEVHAKNEKMSELLLRIESLENDLEEIEVDQMRAQIAEKELAEKQMTASLEAKDAKLDEIVRRCEELEALLEEKGDDEAVAAASAAAVAEAARLRTQVAELEEQLEQAGDASAGSEVEDLRAEVETLEARLEDARERVETLEDELEEAEAKLAKAADAGDSEADKAALAASAAAVAALEKEKEALREQLERVESSVAKEEEAWKRARGTLLSLLEADSASASVRNSGAASAADIAHAVEEYVARLREAADGAAELSDDDDASTSRSSLGFSRRASIAPPPGAPGNAEVDEIVMELVETKMALATAEQERDEVRNRSKQLEAELQKVKSENDDLANGLVSAKFEVANLLENKAILEDKCNRLQQQVKK